MNFLESHSLNLNIQRGTILIIKLNNTIMHVNHKDLINIILNRVIINKLIILYELLNLNSNKLRNAIIIDIIYSEFNIKKLEYSLLLLLTIPPDTFGNSGNDIRKILAPEFPQTHLGNFGQ